MAYFAGRDYTCAFALPVSLALIIMALCWGLLRVKGETSGATGIKLVRTRWSQSTLSKKAKAAQCEGDIESCPNGAKIVSIKSEKLINCLELRCTARELARTDPDNLMAGAAHLPDRDLTLAFALLVSLVLVITKSLSWGPSGGQWCNIRGSNYGLIPHNCFTLINSESNQFPYNIANKYSISHKICPCDVFVVFHIFQ